MLYIYKDYYMHAVILECITGMASSTQWTWVWAISGRWWRIGKPCCSPWGRKESDMTEWLNNNNTGMRRAQQPTPVLLPGESQGWEAWWAAVYGVAQSQTRLKWRSSSSSRRGKGDIHSYVSALQMPLLLWGMISSTYGKAEWNLSLSHGMGFREPAK